MEVKLAFSSLQDRILRGIIYFGKERGSACSQNVFLSHHPSHQTLQSRHPLFPWLLEKESEPEEVLS